MILCTCQFAKCQEFLNVSLQIFERKVLLSILTSIKIFERDLLSSDSVAKSETQIPWFPRLMYVSQSKPSRFLILMGSILSHGMATKALGNSLYKAMYAIFLVIAHFRCGNGGTLLLFGNERHLHQNSKDSGVAKRTKTEPNLILLNERVLKLFCFDARQNFYHV